MKTWLIFILFLVFSTVGYSQLLELFSDQKADLSDWETTTTDLEKRKIIEPLRSIDQFEWPFYNLENSHCSGFAIPNHSRRICDPG